MKNSDDEDRLLNRW